jgi:hypothetical protein
MLQAEVVPGVTLLGRGDGKRWLYPSQPAYSYPWLWWLDSLELERLEELRKGPLMTLTLNWSGVARLTNGPALVPMYGDATIGVASSDWERILRAVLDYQPK